MIFVIKIMLYIKMDRYIIYVETNNKCLAFIFLLPPFPKVRFSRIFTFIKNIVNVYYLI